MSRMRSFFLVLALSLLLVISSVAAAQYNEAPMLKKLVEAGQLPPVEERLPLEPFVVEPVQEIGKYGGTARVAAIEPTWWGDDHMLMSSVATLVQPTADLTDVVPHYAKDYTVSEDATVFTFYLREGMRWSDGQPLTTEDIRFWYEDILQNEELTPAINTAWIDEGELAELNIIDEYTFEWVFSKPRPLFIYDVIHNFVFTPAHYLKQFHPRYEDMDKLMAMAEKEELDSWYALFGQKNAAVGQVPLNPERPTLMSHVLVERTTSRRIYERNPYFWKVDTAGNQLPYIDRIETEIVGDRQVLSGMVISGALDFAAFQNDIRDYPMLRRYEEEGNYQTILWRSALNEVIYQFNQTHTDPALREVFSDARFRKALSLAIDREEINEVIYFGQGKPAQFTVLSASQFYEPEFEQAYAEYDPVRANTLLDEMGLDKKDSEGFRLLPNGERLTFLLEFVDAETPKLANVELVSQYWQEVGIDVRTKVISDALMWERGNANLIDATVWHGDGATDIMFPNVANYFIPRTFSWSPLSWTLYSDWILSRGASGEEPPAELYQLYEWWEEILVEPDADRRLELGKRLLQAQADNIWHIGTITEAPYPITVRNTMRNVPEDGYWAYDNFWITTSNPEQIYFVD